MIERLLGNLWFSIAFWIVGPVILFLLYKKNRKDKAAAAKASDSRGAARAADSRESIPRPEPPPSRTPVPAAAASGETSFSQGPKPELVLRELRWGQPPAEGMTLKHEDGNDKLYDIPGDSLKLGEASYTSILYSFWKDRLQTVRIDVPFQAGEPLLRFLSSQWGRPKQPNPQQERFVWVDTLNALDASMAVLEKNATARKASLRISSKSIGDEREKARASTAL